MNQGVLGSVGELASGAVVDSAQGVVYVSGAVRSTAPNNRQETDQ